MIEMSKEQRKGYDYIFKRMKIIFSCLIVATVLSIFNEPETLILGVVMNVVAVLVLLDLLNLVKRKKDSLYLAVKKNRNGNDRDKIKKTGFLGVFAIPFFPDWTLETVLVFVLFAIGLWVIKEIFWGDR